MLIHPKHEQVVEWVAKTHVWPADCANDVDNNGTTCATCELKTSRKKEHPCDIM